METINLPKPRYTVKMADEDHNYTLEQDGQRIFVGGVTNALGMIGGGKTSALKWWASRIACETYWALLNDEKMRTLLQVAISTGDLERYERYLADAADLAYEAHVADLTRTSVYGTQCHDLYERHTKGEIVNLEDPNLMRGVADSYERFAQWWLEFSKDWEVVAVELPLGSWVYQYGGTADVVLRNRHNQEIAIGDYKNSGGMAVGHAAQVGGAYGQALVEQYNLVPRHAFVIRVPKPEDGGGPVECWDAYESNSPKELFGLFLDAMSMRDRVAKIEKTVPNKRRKRKKAWEK